MTSGRNTRRPILLIGLLLVAACESTTAPEPDTFVGRWDGRMWVGDASAYLAGDGKLYIYGTAPRGADAFSADETLSARATVAGRGTYVLGPDDVYFMELTGGDVVTAEYRGSGVPAGVLRITRYEGPGGWVEGELQFTATTDSPHASYGRSARLDDGRFRARVTAPVP